MSFGLIVSLHFGACSTAGQPLACMYFLNKLYPAALERCPQSGVFSYNNEETSIAVNHRCQAHTESIFGRDLS